MMEKLIRKKSIRDFLSLFTENKWESIITFCVEYSIAVLKKNFNIASLSLDDLLEILDNLNEENCKQQRKGQTNKLETRKVIGSSNSKSKGANVKHIKPPSNWRKNTSSSHNQSFESYSNEYKINSKILEEYSKGKYSNTEKNVFQCNTQQSSCDHCERSYQAVNEKIISQPANFVSGAYQNQPYHPVNNREVEEIKRAIEKMQSKVLELGIKSSKANTQSSILHTTNHKTIKRQHSQKKGDVIDVSGMFKKGSQISSKASKISKESSNIAVGKQKVDIKKKMAIDRQIYERLKNPKHYELVGVEDSLITENYNKSQNNKEEQEPIGRINTISTLVDEDIHNDYQNYNDATQHTKYKTNQNQINFMRHSFSNINDAKDDSKYFNSRNNFGPTHKFNYNNISNLSYTIANDDTNSRKNKVPSYRPSPNPYADEFSTLSNIVRSKNDSVTLNNDSRYHYGANLSNINNNINIQMDTDDQELSRLGAYENRPLAVLMYKNGEDKVMSDELRSPHFN